MNILTGTSLTNQLKSPTLGRPESRFDRSEGLLSDRKVSLSSKDNSKQADSFKEQLEQAKQNKLEARLSSYSQGKTSYSKDFERKSGATKDDGSRNIAQKSGATDLSSKEDTQKLSSPQSDTESKKDIAPKAKDENGSSDVATSSRSEEAGSRKPIKTYPEFMFTPSVELDAVQTTKEPTGPEELISLLTKKVDQLGLKTKSIVDPLSRRAAIQKFMQKMSDEFGVSSLDLVKAFSQLSTAELGLPAHQTVEKVVDHLGLGESESLRAKGYFQSMMKRAEASSMAEYLKSSDRQISLEVMSRKELQTEKLHNSINEMNTQFFAKDGIKEVKNSMPFVRSNGLDKGEASLEGIISEGQGLNLDEKSVQVRSSASSGGPKTLDELLASRVLKDPGQSQKDMGQIGAELSTQSFDSLGEEKKNHKDDTLSSSEDKIDLNALDLTTSAEQDASDNGSEFQQQGSHLNSQLGPDKKEFGSTSLTKEAFTPTMTEADADENTARVLNKAQMLVKKGGGEMKMQLRPEGVGELNLKVAVKDGKVSIDVVTENDHVKKLVEKGLGDLKATLASHKIDVDKVNVDTSTDLQQNLQKEQDQAERRFAQQFLQDFSRQNRQFREGISFYGEKNGIDPIENDKMVNARKVLEAKRKARPDGRLNLVA